MSNNPDNPTSNLISIDQSLTPDDFDTLDDILDDLRTRNSETPQWEFCEGFMAALVCGRRPVPLAEYFPVLLDTGEGGRQICR